MHSTPPSPSSSTTFHLFRLFPLEIRRAIWEFCLPHRIVEIDYPVDRNEWNPPRVCNLATVTTTNARPPAISRVCHEAREVALRHGGECGVVEGKGEEPYYSYYQFPPGPWIQPGRDTLHLHWTPGSLFNDLYWNPDNPDRAIELLHYLAARMRAPAISIMAELVLPFRCWSWVDANIKSPEDTAAVEVLSQRDEYMVVLDMIILHARLDVATRSGLFGVAGDERVKLVDPDDWAVMEEYGRLWRLHGSAQDVEAAEFFSSIADRSTFTSHIAKWRQDLFKVWVWHQWKLCRFRENLHVDSVWLGRDRWGDTPQGFPSYDPANWRPWVIDIEVREPNDEEPWVRMKKQSMPRFQPKIMFRLCGSECYLRASAVAVELFVSPPFRVTANTESNHTGVSVRDYFDPSGSEISFASCAMVRRAHPRVC